MSKLDSYPGFWKLDSCKASTILLSDFSPISGGAGLYYWSSLNNLYPQSFRGGGWGNFAPWPVDSLNGKLDLPDLHDQRFNASLKDGHVESVSVLDQICGCSKSQEPLDCPKR